MKCFQQKKELAIFGQSFEPQKEQSVQQSKSSAQKVSLNQSLLYTPSTLNESQQIQQADLQLEAEDFERRSNLYLFQEGLFKHRTVTNPMRAMLNNWMMVLTTQHKFLRETYALTSYYVDAFLEQNQQFPKERLQLLGYSAFHLAAKMEQSTLPMRVEQEYRLKDIRVYELKILKCLNFRMHPDTYVHWANLAMQKWDVFCDQMESLKTFKYLSQNRDAFRRSRQIFDLCDVLQLDVQTLRFPIEQVVLNVLFIVTRKNIQRIQIKYGDFQSFQHRFYRMDQFFNIYQQFLKIGLFQCDICDFSIAKHIFKYIELPINYTQSDYIRPHPTNPELETRQSYIEYINIQTYNPQMIRLAKRVIMELST